MKNTLPTLFKTLLATTSALTLVSGFTNTAEATPRTSLNPVSTLSVATDWNPNGFNSGDSLVYGGNHTISASTINININVVDTASISLTNPFNVFSSELQFGSIGSTGSGSGVAVNILPGGNTANIYLATMAGGGGILPNDYSKFASLDFNNTKGATLTIQNTSPILLPTNFSSTGGDAGQISIKTGSSATFNGTFSNIVGNRVESLVIETGAVGTFNNDLSISQSVNLGSGGDIIFGPNVTINTPLIAPNFVNIGSVTFQGNAKANCKIGVGNDPYGGSPGNPVHNVNIGSGEVNFNETIISSENVNFTQNDSSLSLGNPNALIIDASLLNTTGNDNKGKIKVSNYTDVMGYNTFETVVGLPGANLENINFEADARFAAWTPQLNVQSVTTSVDGEGSLVMRSNSDKEITGDIGSSTKKLKNVIPTIGPMYEGFVTTTLTTLKSGKSIYANEFKLYAESEISYVLLDSSIFVLEDNTFIDAPITTSAPGGFGGDPFSGTFNLVVNYTEVDVQSNATILQDIGTTDNKVDYIRLQGAPGSTVNLSGDFHSNNIDLQQPNIVFGDDVIFDGKVSSDSTTYSLSNHTLFFDNARSSEIFGNPVVNFTVDDSKHGHFVVRGGTVDMNEEGADSLNLNLRDLAAILPPVGPVGQSYTVFGIVEGTGEIVVIPDAKAAFNILQQNPFVTWSYTNGVATRKRKAQEEIDQIVRDTVTSNGGSQTATANALLLADSNNTDDALSVFQNITSVIITNTDDLLLALNALQPIIVEAAEQVSEAVDQAISTIASRLKSLGIPAFALAQGEEGGGVAAGDEGYKNGAWASTYYGTVQQKARGESAGFKSHTSGVMIGVDTMVTDEHTVGMSLSYSSNKVKHKDGNEGDTSKVKSYTISIYGMQEINDKWFVQGVGLFSRNAINNRERRFIPGGVEIARGDFDVNAYGTEVLVGYNHLVTDKVLMTTTMGAEFLRLSNSRYKETGTTNQNLLVSKKDDNKLDVIVGTSFAYNGSFKNYTLIPEMHGNITYDVLNKSPKIAVQLAGLAGDRLVNKTAEQTRVFYNIGVGLSVLRGATDFSAGYDLFLGKKYIGHQGSLKARINF